MKTGEKLFKFLAGLILQRFYGTVAIKFEAGKVTHVETETRRVWQYKELPEQMSDASSIISANGIRTEAECSSVRQQF